MPVMVVDKIQEREAFAEQRPPASPVLDIALAPGRVRGLPACTFGLRIRCAGAPLWITQENDPEDYWLDTGKMFTVTEPGLVVLQGMEICAE